MINDNDNYNDPFRFHRRASELLAPLYDGYKTRSERAITRQFAVCKLAEEFPEKTTTQIARAAGYKDHSSALYALGRLPRKPAILRKDPEAASAVERPKPVPRSKPLPEISELAALYASMGTVRAVSRHLGVDEKRVSRALREGGVKVASSHLPPPATPKELPSHLTEEDVIAAYRRINSQRATSEHLGIGEGIVRRIIRKHIPDMTAHLQERLESARAKRAAANGSPAGGHRAEPRPRPEPQPLFQEPIVVVDPFAGFDDALRRSLHRLREWPGIVPANTEHEHGGFNRIVWRQHHG